LFLVFIFIFQELIFYTNYSLCLLIVWVYYFKVGEMQIRQIVASLGPYVYLYMLVVFIE